MLAKYGMEPPEFHWYQTGVVHWCNMESYVLQVTQVYDELATWAVHGYANRLKRGKTKYVETAKQRAEQAYITLLLNNPIIMSAIDMEVRESGNSKNTI